ncbi:MAG: glycoside hydrolase family 28 protein, partial [Lachnospiraceae bacterium]|nr:glycoside hydrolase family 28 protein [Lachnospiraceae bacterium]
MKKAELKEAILEQIKRPDIPEREYPAQDFGIQPDREEIQTGLLQRAVDAISKNGGGRLVLPAGRYRTGALELKSRVELHLQSRDTVLAFVNEEPELHYPVVFVHWEASPCYNFSPLIYACGAHDIAVTGEGTLDGGADADHWWNWHHQVEDAWSSNDTDLQLADRGELRRMNLEGVPVEQRVFGPGHYLRPNFVQLIRCERVLLQGFTLKNSPMWQLNPVMCRSLTVDGVTMSSHGANNDGCDPESCSGVHICNCRFDTGDDCISLKSGRDRDGRLANVPCEDVLIENNEFADGHGGVALGSEMSGGIRRVLAVNNRFSSPNLTYALRLKTNARRGGSVEDVILADSVMDHVHGAAVHGTMLYEDGRNGDDLPVFKNITIENITAHGGDYGIFLEAFDEVPITGLTLRNIRIDGAAKPMRSMNWENPVIENVVINGQRFPRPGSVRILGVTEPGAVVEAHVQACGLDTACRFLWESSADGSGWRMESEGKSFSVPEAAAFVRVTAVSEPDGKAVSRPYRVLKAEMPMEVPMKMPMEMP